MGPYEKAPKPVLLTSENKSNPFYGPGHACILETSQGEFFVLYHAWIRDENGEPVYERGRQMLRDSISWTSDGWPVVGNGGEPTFDAHSRDQKKQQSTVVPPVLALDSGLV